MFYIISLSNRRNEEHVGAEKKFGYMNGRDITASNFYTRGVSPITMEAFLQCTSNPSFDCFVNTTFQCNENTGGNSLKAPTLSFDEAFTNSMCPADSNCYGAINDLFDNFDLAKETNTDASPICMAVLGPNVDGQGIQEPNYDQCSLLFDLELDQTGASTYDYGNIIDIKCNQRSRALMCTMLGILLSKTMFLGIKSLNTSDGYIIMHIILVHLYFRVRNTNQVSSNQSIFI